MVSEQEQRAGDTLKELKSLRQVWNVGGCEVRDLTGPLTVQIMEAQLVFNCIPKGRIIFFNWCDHDTSATPDDTSEHLNFFIRVPFPIRWSSFDLKPMGDTGRDMGTPHVAYKTQWPPAEPIPLSASGC
ncbi:hypothetical protein AAG570_008649 [Ranatra chinensis]|uniref:Uncharacterized protein n=1 Tax=Ranatra chinensis TaxID=642074 RepID=A0ABD0YRK0_9HEMI